MSGPHHRRTNAADGRWAFLLEMVRPRSIRLLWHIWRHDLNDFDRIYPLYVVGFPAVICVLAVVALIFRGS